MPGRRIFAIGGFLSASVPVFAQSPGQSQPQLPEGRQGHCRSGINKVGFVTIH
jgi:hypothetical protein